MHSTRRPIDPLDRILDEDTREEMRRLMPLIQSRTGPGSGFEIRADRVTGIRPICAFLASERLGNNDINVETARKAACLAPKHFNETLDTIRRALSSKPEKAKSVAHSPYLNLLTDYGILNNQDFVLGYMNAFEREVATKLPARLKPPNDVVIITVFVFTCQIIGMSKRIDAGDLRKRHKVTQKDFDKVQTALQTSCSHIEQSMRNDIKALRASKTAGGSPTKQTPARSPTKPAIPLGAPGTLSRTPTRKRKLPGLAFEDDMAMDETPSKRQRRQTRSTDPAAFHAVFSRPSGSKTALELLGNMQSEDDGDASSVEPITAESDQDMDALSEHSAAGASSGSEEPEPRTPRRTTRTFNMVTPSRTAAERNAPSRTPGKMTKIPADDDDEDRPAQRRYRPVFLGHKQWQQEDSRVARERREREERMRQWLAERGIRHPFDVVVQEVAPVSV